MNRETFLKYLPDPRAINIANDFETGVLFLDNASGHEETVDFTHSPLLLNTSMVNFPENSKYLASSLGKFFGLE